MSFRHRENNKGPITVPCGGVGTQQNWSPQSDFTPFTTTRCCLKHRKESIHFNVFPQSIAKQFAFKGCNKCLFKIQYECVNLSSIVQHFSPMCRSQHFVSVKSSSLFHHSIYPVLYCPKF